MQIRVSESDWDELCDELLQERRLETAGLLMGELLATPNGPIIAIREVAALPASAYLVRRADQISIDAIALNKLTRIARARRWCVVTIHTHPHASEPWFSRADDAGDARLMPALHSSIPHLLHGSIVVTESRQTIARLFDATGQANDASLHIVGRTLRSNTRRADSREQWFARQQLALGAHGQAQLRTLRVAVVGLGGVGSIVAMQLAHLGVGGLVLIDGDRVESSNLSRIVGATPSDVGTSFKVNVADRYARATGLVRDIVAVREFVGPEHLELLASCDVVFSCVDRATPRALLNRFAYRALVPIIDMGTVFQVDETGGIVAEAGRVVVVGPGRPCLACWGHLDPDLLREEALSATDRRALEADGYIRGTIEVQPSVVAFNTQVAGSAVIEFLRLATGFAGAESPPHRLAFSFTDGTIRRNSLAHGEQCRICCFHNPASSCDGLPEAVSHSLAIHRNVDHRH